MDKSTRLEILMRTIRLEGVAESFAQIDAARQAMIDTFQRTHESVGGQRRKLTKRRKIAKYKEITARIFNENVDIRQDAIHQVRAVDKDA